MSSAYFARIDGVPALVNCKGDGKTMVCYQTFYSMPIEVEASRIETFYPCEGTMIIAVNDNVLIEMDAKDGYYICARACRNGCKVEW